MNKAKISFHQFCLARMIPAEIEIRFVEFFRDFFINNFSSSDDFIFNYLVNQMTEEEIMYYWNMYIRNLRYTIQEV